MSAKNACRNEYRGFEIEQLAQYKESGSKLYNQIFYKFNKF